MRGSRLDSYPKSANGAHAQKKSQYQVGRFSRQPRRPYPSGSRHGTERPLVSQPVNEDIVYPASQEDYKLFPAKMRRETKSRAVLDISSTGGGPIIGKGGERI